MRMLLILVNLLLAGFIVFGALAAFSSGSEEPVTAVREKKTSPVKLPSAVKGAEKAKKQVSPSSPDEDAAGFVRNNIFNPERCPDARVPGRTNTQVQLTMTLVGTVTAGDVRAAIILQKNRNLNAMQNSQWLRNPPPGMEDRQSNSRTRSNNNTPGGGNPPNAAQTTDSEITYKQYVRVGETLANGYRLESVTRTGAVLVKGSERLELTIQEASKGQGAATATGTAAKKTQNNPAVPDPEQFRRMFEERRRAMEQMRGPGGEDSNSGSNNDRSGNSRSSRPSRGSRNSPPSM